MAQRATHPSLDKAGVFIVVSTSTLATAFLRGTVATSAGGHLRHVAGPQVPYWMFHRDDLPFSVFFAMYNGVPLLLVASLGVVALSMLKNRRSSIRIAQRPGFVLCLAALAASAWTAVIKIMAWCVADALEPAPWDLVLNRLVPNVGFMVLGSWLTLALVGRAWPGPSWVDRAGYGLGAVLVCLMAVNCARLFLETVPFLWT